MKIRNSAEASQFINAAIHSHIHLWDKMQDTEDYLINSEPPFDGDDLEKDGQEWRNNWNYGKGRSQIEQGVINNSTDVFNSFAFIDIEFNRYNPKVHKSPLYGFLVDDYVKGVLKSAIRSAFIDVLEEDERTHVWVSAIEYYSFTFGYCPIIRDDFSYLGDPVPLKDIAFEDRTKIGEVRNFVVFDSIKVDFLYEKYLHNKERLDQAKKIEYLGEEYRIMPDGWIWEGLFDILKNKIEALGLSEKFEDDPKGEKNKLKIVNWEVIEEVVARRGLNYLDYNIGNIFIGKIFNLQPDGTVDETYIVTESINNTKVQEQRTYTSVRQQLLYQKSHKKNISDILTLVKEYGITKDLIIHELRGAGKYIAEDAYRYDIKRNAIEDKLLIAGSPFLQSPNSLTSKQSKIKVCAGFNIVGDDIQMLPNQVRYDLNDHVRSIDSDNREHEERVFHYNPKLNLSSRPTTDEVTLRGGEVSAQKRSKLPIKLADYSRVFTLALRDLAIKEFDGLENKANQDKFFECIDVYLQKYGIILDRKQIKQIIKEIKQVKLSPAHGDAQAIQQAMEIAGSSEQRKQLMIMFLLALGFSRKNAWEFVDVEDFGDQLDKAAAENDMFHTTSEVPVGRHQDLLTHLNTHFAKADRVLQGVQGGEDPVKAFHWLTNCLVNTGGHIELMQSNPFFRKQLKRYVQIQGFFQQKAQQLSQLIEQMKQQEAARAQQQAEGQQQQQEQQLDPKTQASIYNDRIKMLDKIERTNILTEHRKQEKEKMLEFNQEIERKRAEGQMTIQREMAEMQKELALLKKSVELAS